MLPVVLQKTLEGLGKLMWVVLRLNKLKAFRCDLRCFENPAVPLIKSILDTLAREFQQHLFVFRLFGRRLRNSPNNTELHAHYSVTAQGYILVQQLWWNCQGRIRLFNTGAHVIHGINFCADKTTSQVEDFLRTVRLGVVKVLALVTHNAEQIYDCGTDSRPSKFQSFTGGQIKVYCVFSRRIAIVCFLISCTKMNGNFSVNGMKPFFFHFRGKRFSLVERNNRKLGSHNQNKCVMGMNT